MAIARLGTLLPRGGHRMRHPPLELSDGHSLRGGRRAPSPMAIADSARSPINESARQHLPGDQESVLFTSAARMPNELAGAEMHGQIARALRKYTRPTAGPRCSSSTTSPSSRWTARKRSSPFRSSASATTIAARRPSPPIVPSRTGRRSSPTRSTPRSLPSDSPSAAKCSSSTKRAVPTPATAPARTGGLQPGVGNHHAEASSRASRSEAARREPSWPPLVGP